MMLVVRWLWRSNEESGQSPERSRHCVWKPKRTISMSQETYNKRIVVLYPSAIMGEAIFYADENGAAAIAAVFFIWLFRDGR